MGQTKTIVPAGQGQRKVVGETPATKEQAAPSEMSRAMKELQNRSTAKPKELLSGVADTSLKASKDYSARKTLMPKRTPTTRSLSKD